MGIKAQLKIMNAFREGKPIQRIPKDGAGYYAWEDISGDHSFDFNHFEYRIKACCYLQSLHCRRA